MHEQKAKKRGFQALFGQKNKKQVLLLIGGLVLGILLLLIGNGSLEKKTSPATQAQDASLVQESYRADLEKRIEALCESVKGVGTAKAMVTLGSGYTAVYANDANGSPATVGNGSSEAALQQTLRPPTVVGVGVVCKGGDDPRIQQQLTDLLSTALGIPSSRVCILGK